MLAEFAARLIFQFAARGRTWAGNNILNTPIDPLSGLMDANSDFSPRVCVYSDDTEAPARGQELNGAGAKAGLTISIYVPPSARIVSGDQEIELEGRGPLAMFVIDVIGYQLRQALLDLNSPWARLWSRFIPKIEKITLSPPFLETDKGQRVPSRVLMIEFTPIADPVFGRPMTETWQALYDQMKTEPNLVTLAEMLKTAIEQPSVAPDWKHVMMVLGLSDQTAESVGLRPLEPVEDPTLAEVDTYDPSIP